mmetsp:Transcript_6750/g.14755  ORF Transcript_6750/g.14755 Transcript_6750/m.14755 type:complete len:197 (-) Transcript_6750:46-636(-)
MPFPPLFLMVAHLLLSCCIPASSFLPPPRLSKTSSTHCQHVVISTRNRRTRLSPNALVMRDASSANAFNIGDRVKVVDDVEKAGINLKGRVGIVKETWVKCDVDPTCCCAEFVDDAFAVHVTFETERQADEKITDEDTFVHYFAERELVEMKEDINTQVAFDGMSCKAFKLDKLQMGEQAQRIAAFEKAKAREAET